MITREDFFSKWLEEKRTFFGDAIFNLIECDNEEVVNFGEFTEALVTYCLFEQNDILRLIFNIFDTEKTGFIDKDEMKHFLLMLHDGELKSNGQKGLEMIEQSQRQGMYIILFLNNMAYHIWIIILLLLQLTIAITLIDILCVYEFDT